MAKIIQFPKYNQKGEIEDCTKYKESKDDDELENNYIYETIYSKEYELHILIKYPNKKEQEKHNEKNKKRENTRNKNLEIVLNQIKKFKENIPKYQVRSKSNLENKLKEKYISPKNYNPKPSSKDQELKNYASHMAYNSTSHHINPRSGAHVFYVPSSYLPPNVLGMYVPALHTYYVASDLPENLKKFVYYHEEWHSLYGEGEAQADAYAEQKTGFNPRYARAA